MNPLAPLTAGILFITTLPCQQPFVAESKSASPAELSQIAEKLTTLRDATSKLPSAGRDAELAADVAIYGKAAEWIVRHGEFYTDKYAAWTVAALDRGIQRARELAAGSPTWPNRTGRLSRGFVSKVDGSVQPYGLVIPAAYGRDSNKRWRLDVELHGRGATLNEVSFLNAHDSAQDVPDDQDFIQLDIFGRTNNAYRWAGETDVFEAIESVRRRYNIDERRVVLRGFSMGGAGAWHLGLHFPDKWSSVGPGAGFTDTKKYQKITSPLEPWQEATLHVYDAEDYASNAFNVPIVAYGGEDDPQLAASRRIKESLETYGVRFRADGLNATTDDIPFLYLVGPKTGHKFEPESRRRAMEFHAKHAAKPLPYIRDRLDFTTYTVKYPGAFGYTIREMDEPYKRTTLKVHRDAEGVLQIQADNARLLEVTRGFGGEAQIGDTRTNLDTAAGGLLPTILFRQSSDRWTVLDYDQSLAALRSESGVTKVPGLQGPIDDAFMDSFLCVTGTSTPWSPAVARWATWSLDRFAREWDKYMRGTIRIVTDTSLDLNELPDANLILFGDPGSNRLIDEIMGKLPIRWTREMIQVGTDQYSSADHGVVLIFPNPLAPRRYVVINSGHTFHAEHFRASNAQLYPRLGDYAVQKLAETTGGGFEERVVRAGIFDSDWRIPNR